MKKYYLHLIYWLAYWVLDLMVNFIHYRSERLAELLFDSSAHVAILFLISSLYLRYFLSERGRNSSKLKNILIALICVALLFFSRYFLVNFSLGFDANNWLPFTKIFKNFIRDLALVALAVSLSIIHDWKTNKQRLQEIEKAKLKLQYQVLLKKLQPHFLFNTLNNIYSLVQQNDERAGDALIKLSEVLEYTVYQNAYELISLEKELIIVNAYLELMNLKYGEDLQSSIETENMKIEIPAFSLLSLIENAFKHGAKIEGKFLLKIVLRQNQNQFELSVENGLQKEIPKIKEANGLGLLRMQLENFPDRFGKMKIEKGSHFFKVIIFVKKNFK